MPGGAPILVTGGTGQLASALEAGSSAHGLTVRRVGRPDFDFDNLATLDAVFAETAPQLVVNAAAYTAVDAAEDEPDAAMRANHDGPARLAQLCAASGIPLIHISTDYVFDGRKGSPYQETDLTAPQGVYGTTKLAGEQAVLASCQRSIVLRTSWVYSPVGRNFVRTMLTVAQRTNRLRVVADQIGCPTSAVDLAEAILTIAAEIGTRGWQDRYAGVYHATGFGFTSWHGLAVAVFAAAARHGAPVPEVEPIATSDWPTKAVRPADSRLDCSKLDAIFGLHLPRWEDGLARTIDTLFLSAVPQALQPNG